MAISDATLIAVLNASAKSEEPISNEKIAELAAATGYWSDDNAIQFHEAAKKSHDEKRNATVTSGDGNDVTGASDYRPRVYNQR